MKQFFYEKNETKKTKLPMPLFKIGQQFICKIHNKKFELVQIERAVFNEEENEWHYYCKNEDYFFFPEKYFKEECILIP